MAIAPPGPVSEPDQNAPHRNNLTGILWMLFSVVGASAMTVAVRQVSVEIDSRMIVMLRAGLTLALIFSLLPIAGLWRKMRFSRPRDHIIRGSFIAVSTHLGFYTLVHLPLAQATILFFTAPIFATVLSATILGEKVGPRRWSAVGAGFLGALIILRPGMVEFHPAMLTALGSSLLFAGALTMSRGLAQADGPLSTYVSSVVITVILTAPVIPPVFALPTTPLIWGAVAVLIIGGTARGVADIQAYRYGDAGVVGTVAYLRLVLIGLAGYVIFGERVDLYTGLGAAIIVGSTLYIAQREAQRGKTG